jgi:hypothetical protein
MNKLELKKLIKEVVNEAASGVYTLNQLNKIAQSGNQFVSLEDIHGERYTLDHFEMENEDGEKILAVYVHEMPEYIPYEEVNQFYVSTPIKVK